MEIDKVVILGRRDDNRVSAELTEYSSVVDEHQVEATDHHPE